MWGKKRFIRSSHAAGQVFTLLTDACISSLIPTDQTHINIRLTPPRNKKKNTQYLFLLRLGCHRKLDKLPKSPGEGEARLCENAASNQQRAGERRSEGGRLPVLQDVPDCRLGPYFSPRLIPLPGQRRGNRASSQAEEDIRDAVRLDLYLVSHYNQQQCLF